MTRSKRHRGGRSAARRSAARHSARKEPIDSDEEEEWGDWGAADGFPGRAGLAEMLDELMDMGFPEEWCVKALREKSTE